MTPTSFCDVLEAHATARPKLLAYRFLRDGEDDTQTITYEELFGRALAVARALGEAARPDDRALLLYEPGIEYVAGLLGCFMASVVAVPSYPPDAIRLNRWVSRTNAMLVSASPRVVLASSLIGEHEPLIKQLAPNLADLPWLLTDKLAPETTVTRARRTSMALLQYTSGSTGQPKGVMLTHANLMANARHVSPYFSREGTAVGWLPPYHDMGLMGLLLQPLHEGVPSNFMSPLHFLQQPDRWLRAIDRYRANFTVGPNFAFELCTRKVKGTGLDLRCLRVVFNGAEPLRADVMDAFADKFRPNGFDRRAFVPCYGLAESTLIVTGVPPGVGSTSIGVARTPLKEGRVALAGPDDERHDIVRCGPPIPGTEVRVVDPETRRPLGERQIGEIWVRGESVASGYFEMSEATATVFDAHTEAMDGPYLRTGDLGFFDDGELCVTGRRKDLIIICGQNHYPQDIETTIEDAHPTVRRGCVAVFALERDGREMAGAAFEVALTPSDGSDDEILEAIRRAVRGAVASHHNIQLGVICILKKGALPKTSSGKLMRAETAAAYLRGDLGDGKRGQHG